MRACHGEQDMSKYELVMMTYWSCDVALPWRFWVFPSSWQNTSRVAERRNRTVQAQRRHSLALPGTPPDAFNNPGACRRDPLANVACALDPLTLESRSLLSPPQ